MDTQRFIAGAFRFTFSNGRLFYSYKKKHFGHLVSISGNCAANLTLCESLHTQCETPEQTGALTRFVRFMFPDFPGAVHEAEHRDRMGGHSISAMPA